MLKINEVHGLFVDHYLTDRTGDLLFLSLWGRDTAVRELQARLSLPASEQGLRSLSLENGTRCRISDIDDYRQETGRVPPSRSTLRDAWRSGCWPGHLNPDDCSLLQRLRNRCGPRWLQRYRID